MKLCLRGGSWCGALKDSDIPHAHDEPAGGLFRKLGSEGLFILLKFDKLHFDQFMQRQAFGNALDETFAEAGLANFEHRFEMLRARLELPDFRVSECVHAKKLAVR